MSMSTGFTAVMSWVKRTKLTLTKQHIQPNLYLVDNFYLFAEYSTEGTIISLQCNCYTSTGPSTEP